MRTLLGLMLGMAVLQAGCDDDDDDDGIIVPGADAAVGQATVFDVTLTPQMEVPLCASAGLNATGTATVTIAPNDSSVTVTNVTFSGLSGPVTAAHIHNGEPGVAGPIVFPLMTTVVPFSTMTFEPSDYPSPVPAGASPDFPSFITAMKAGDTYINFHTAACPPGEIRAQLR